MSRDRCPTRHCAVRARGPPRARRCPRRVCRHTRAESSRLRRFPRRAAPIRTGLRYDFRYGIPPSADFPHETWSRLVTRGRGRMTLRTLRYGRALGYGPLREAIAHYVTRARGVVGGSGSGDRHQRLAAGARPRRPAAPRSGRSRRRRGALLPGGAARVRRRGRAARPGPVDEPAWTWRGCPPRSRCVWPM